MQHTPFFYRPAEPFDIILVEMHYREIFGMFGQVRY